MRVKWGDGEKKHPNENKRLLVISYSKFFQVWLMFSIEVSHDVSFSVVAGLILWSFEAGKHEDTFSTRQTEFTRAHIPENFICSVCSMSKAHYRKFIGMETEPATKRNTKQFYWKWKCWKILSKLLAENENKSHQWNIVMNYGYTTFNAKCGEFHECYVWDIR